MSLLQRCVIRNFCTIRFLIPICPFQKPDSNTVEMATVKHDLKRFSKLLHFIALEDQD